MKTFGMFLLLLMLGAPAAAQSDAQSEAQSRTPTEVAAAETHGLSVVKANWSRRFYNQQPAPEDDPLRSAAETLQLERERKEPARPTSSRRGVTRDPRPPPRNTDVLGGITSGESRHYYVYEIKVLNNGTKKIKSLAWDYVLLDPSTRREVGRHSFETTAGIALGKGKTLVGMSTMPPVSILDAKRPEKGAPAKFEQRVDILRVVYEDGAVWERPREQ
jgi:hypothetical protein